MSLTISTHDLVHRVVEEIWNKGDVELADAMFTPNYVNHGGLIPDLICGPEAIKLSVALYRAAFPNFLLHIAGLSTEDGVTTLRWVAHRRPPSTQTPVARGMRGITRCRLQNGKIVESWTVRDSRVSLVRIGGTKRSHGKHCG